MVNVVSDDSAKINDMIRNDVDMFHEIYKIIGGFEKLESDDMDSVKELFFKLHMKLLELDHQKNQQLELIEKLRNDRSYVYHLLKENEGV